MFEVEETWKNTTFAEYATANDGEGEFMDKLLASFGDDLIRLGDPIREIQKLALAKVDFAQSGLQRCLGVKVVMHLSCSARAL